MSLKNILPFENYTLTTRLSTEEIQRRISENVEPQNKYLFGFYWIKSTKQYQGEVSNNSFTIMRITRGSNSFAPIITGNIISSAGTTQIKIKMRLNIFVLLFTIVWFGAVGYGLISAILKSRNILQNGPSADLVVASTMFLFGCVLFTLPFKEEVRKSKKFFNELFEGEQEV